MDFLKNGTLERVGMVEVVYMGSAMHNNQTHAPAGYAELKSKLGYDTRTSYLECQWGFTIDDINHSAIMIADGAESYSRLYSKFSMAAEPYRVRCVHQEQPLKNISETE